jgi:hypothetical protein
MPPASFGHRWEIIIDTGAGLRLKPRTLKAADRLEVAERTMLVLSRASSAYSVFHFYDTPRH